MYFLITDVLTEVKEQEVPVSCCISCCLLWLLAFRTREKKNVRGESLLQRTVYPPVVIIALHMRATTGIKREKTSLNWKIEFAFLCRYPFVCLPFLKSQRNIQPAPSTSAAPSSICAWKRQKKWLSLPGNIRLWLQCKLIWKADAHTSYFTHKKLKLITVTPAEPGAANLVWRLPACWWAVSLVPLFLVFILGFSEKHDDTVKSDVLSSERSRNLQFYTSWRSLSYEGVILFPK